MNQLTAKVTAFWAKVPNAIRSGWITAWITFVGSLLSIVTGLLPKLSEAISSGNFDTFYESLSLGLTAVVSASLGFFAGIVNGVYRWLQPIENSYKEVESSTE